MTHGQIHSLDRANPLAEAVAIADGKIVAPGSHDRIMSFAAEGTQIVDLKGPTVIPGLNDSHLHLIVMQYTQVLATSLEGQRFAF
ncbi:hypothetical protein Q6242_27205, partial [Klebsiella pneumoniae]|nr:hypothetical protein [Klebsiella pneumoniae]